MISLIKLLGLLSVLLAVAASDYYDILGVSRDASEREIKKAYRALSRQYHPDKNRGNDAVTQKFVEIANAYEVLSNKEDRAKYDRYGEDGLKGQQHHDPMDLFSRFFGGGFGGGGPQGRRKGPNAQGVVAVKLTDSYKGSTLEFKANMQGICDECDGSGSADGKRVTCDKCHGSGQVVIQHQMGPGIVQRFQMACDKCGGQGSTIKTPCKVCHGNKVIREDRKYNIFLPEGAPREWDYVLEGEADQSPDYDPGDLIIHIVEAKEENLGYRRRSKNLFRTEPLSAHQAQYGGWTRKISRLDQESHIILSRDQNVTILDGEIEVVKGEGMPGEDGPGDLYIKYAVIPVSPDNKNAQGYGKNEL